MKHSILLIEDNLEMQSLLRILLEDAGYSLYSATTAYDALNVLETNSNLSLILLDLTLPDMPADVFLSKVKTGELAKGSPIVYFSANPYLNQMPLIKGVTGVIQKPFQIDSFLKQILEFIQEHQKHTPSGLVIKPEPKQFTTLM
jgi:CheY-like chemotaxis protein